MTYDDALQMVRGRFNGIVRGLCSTYVHEIVKLVPGLRVARGYYGGSPHWWLVEEGTGRILDPTVEQFGDLSAAYEEYDLDKHGPLPIGKCPNCGFEVYEADAVQGCCNAECAAEYGAYIRRCLGETL